MQREETGNARLPLRNLEVRGDHLLEPQNYGPNQGDQKVKKADSLSPKPASRGSNTGTGGALLLAQMYPNATWPNEWPRGKKSNQSETPGVGM